jgi:hypothetical protein
LRRDFRHRSVSAEQHAHRDRWLEQGWWRIDEPDDAPDRRGYHSVVTRHAHRTL